MDRKSKYIIAGLVLIIILMLITFFFIIIGGIAGYLIFLAPSTTANVTLTTNNVEPVNNPELNEGWNPVLDESDDNSSNECVEDWSCSDWSECVDGSQSRTCTELNKCGTSEYKPSESQTCEVSLTQVNNVKINSLTPVCAVSAPQGFGSGGTPIKEIELKNTGHDDLNVSGKIKVSIIYNNVTDSTIEFEENFSIKKNETYSINLIKAYQAGWSRGYLYAEGTTGIVTIRIDLPNNKFIEATASITGLC